MGMATKTTKLLPTQKGQNILNMNEDQARTYLEGLLWPNGAFCRHCGSTNVYKMVGTSCRPGLHRCRDCEKQFTVTVGTIFEDSHLPLATWVKAFHMIVSAKKGISALQLQRNLGLGSYKTAWFMAHRIRLAMKCDPMNGLMKGAVQCDETYVGADFHGKERRPGAPKRKTGRATDKTPVFALVETGGRARSMPIKHVDIVTLKAAMVKHVDTSAVIVTDELRSYPKAAAEFAGHETVKHSDYEYKNERGYHTNEVESYFALLKRGIIGAFHHVSPTHLHRYCDEFDFRWSNRHIKDAERREVALRQVMGKRLMYKTPVA
jgi:transposase-like protein